MDSLDYKYYACANQLWQVRDAVNKNNYPGDIDDQSDISNYTYDAIGNLIQDKHERIDSIKWDVYGKIQSIHKSGDTSIHYSYDAGGNRISKTVFTPGDSTTTWYVRDASGNVMSVYNLKNDSAYQDELHLYGSSRIGILKPRRNLNLDSQYGDTSVSVSFLGTAKGGVFQRGLKLFELSNHLGNVLVTVSDKKIGVPKQSDPTLVDYYNADVISAQDYYPGGMQMVGRKYNSDKAVYGFGGKRKDNEMYGEGNAYDFDERIYDPRLVKWLSVDPLQKKFPGLTPYNYCYNNPIRFFDPDGKVGIEVQVKYNAETKKYTILKITFTDDLEPRPAPHGSFGVDWFDYITVYDNPAGNPELANSSLTPLFHVDGDKRTNTLVEAKWYAKLKVDDGPFEERGGIMFTSNQDGGGGGEETRVGRYADGQNTIDGLIAMANGGGKLAGHEFEKKGLLEILDKVAEAITEISGKKFGDKLDMNDPSQAKVFKELDELIAKYSGNSSMPLENTSRVEPGKPNLDPMFKKPGNVVFRREGGFKTEIDNSSGGGHVTDKAATDTFPKKPIQPR